MAAGSHELGNIHKYVTHVVKLIPFLGIDKNRTYPDTSHDRIMFNLLEFLKLIASRVY